MNTQSHVIINYFLLRKFFRGEKISYFNFLVIFGSILPDLPMFLFFVFYTLIGTPQSTIWGELYFSQSWQAFFNMFNSIPLFLLILIIALIIKNKSVLVFSLANLLHFLGDIFVHQKDAHAHFFPLTNWKFHSPVSYWDPSSNGFIFSIFENLVVLIISIYLYRRIKNKWGRFFIVLVNLFNIFSYLIWYFVFSL